MQRKLPDSARVCISEHRRDQGSILSKTLERALAGSRSLLQIGAADPLLAEHLASLVERYHAVELSYDQTTVLRGKKLSVTQAKFPCPVSDLYDCVLACHTLPFEERQLGSFLQSAWSRVRFGGKLMVVTYDDDSYEWHSLLAESGLIPWVSDRMGRTQDLGSALELLGVLKVEAVGFELTFPEDVDLVASLARVFSAGDPVLFREFRGNSNVRALLARNHFDGSTYTFPLTLIVYEVHRRKNFFGSIEM